MSLSRLLKKSCRRAALWTGGLLAVIGLAATAEKITNTGKDFNAVLQYHNAPNETQPKSTLSGAEAEFQSGGLILIHGLKLQSLTTNAHVEMSIESPQCVFDTANNTASSAGHLEARSGDGRLFIEGEGFFFQQTNSHLIISNRVRTVIRDTPMKPSKQ